MEKAGVKCKAEVVKGTENKLREFVWGFMQDPACPQLRLWNRARVAMGQALA